MDARRTFSDGRDRIFYYQYFWHSPPSGDHGNHLNTNKQTHGPCPGTAAQRPQTPPSHPRANATSANSTPPYRQILSKGLLLIRRISRKKPYHRIRPRSHDLRGNAYRATPRRSHTPAETVGASNSSSRSDRSDPTDQSDSSPRVSCLAYSRNLNSPDGSPTISLSNAAMQSMSPPLTKYTFWRKATVSPGFTGGEYPDSL